MVGMHPVHEPSITASQLALAVVHHGLGESGGMHIMGFVQEMDFLIYF